MKSVNKRVSEEKGLKRFRAFSTFLNRLCKILDPLQIRGFFVFIIKNDQCKFSVYSSWRKGAENMVEDEVENIKVEIYSILDINYHKFKSVLYFDSLERWRWIIG